MQSRRSTRRTWQAEGRRIVGRKVGLDVEGRAGAAWRRPARLRRAVRRHARLPTAERSTRTKVIQAKCEAEIALVLSAALPDPDTTAEAVAAATACVHAAIEIVDSRIADWKISFRRYRRRQWLVGLFRARRRGAADRRARSLHLRNGAGGQRPDRVGRRRGRLPGPSAQCGRLARLDAGARGEPLRARAISS